MNTEQKIKELVPISKNINDIINKLNKKSGGGIIKKIKEVIEREKIDISHFVKFTPKPLKFKLIKKICPICKKEFETQDGLKHEKNFCDKLCANQNRTHTEETKEKIRQIVLKKLKETGYIKKTIKKECENCNKFFITKSSHKNKKCCSISCSRKLSWKNNKYKNTNFSEIQKKAYEIGTQKIGGGKTKWLKYDNIKVQGTYELRTCFILDKLKKINNIYKWEYTKDRINYIGVDNKKHSYLLDFKIWLNEKDFYYLETKGRIMENDEIKWKTVKEKKLNIIIWFLKDIKTKEKELKIENNWKI